MIKLIKSFSKQINHLQTAMGTTQFITATIGMIIAFVIYRFEKRKETKEA